MAGEGRLLAARKQRRSTEPYEDCPGYVFEQFRV